VRRLLFAIAVLLVLPSPFRAAPELDLVVLSDRIGFAPLYFKARVTVEKHEDNRELCLVGAVGEMLPFVRCYTLQGAAEPRTHWFEVKRGLDAGDYLFTATVRRPLSRIQSPSVQVRALSRGETLKGSK
jgi:hypothetical protein